MVQHLSVRVPWHDNGWDGTICKHPEQNQACRALGNIAEKKQDAIEIAYFGQKSEQLEESYQPPCLLESGAFMAQGAQPLLPIRHPYKKNQGFKHIKDTEFALDPYSFIGRPYWWTLRENARWCMGQDGSHEGLYFTQYDDLIEPETYSERWVSNGENQRVIFEYFYRNVTPDKSIAVAYAKSLPFIESPGRVIIGFGHITSLGAMREYNYTQEPTDEYYSAYLWERPIRHSIRENQENGFLFPFAHIQSYLRNNPEQSPDELVVFAPDEYYSEFSYATEQLSHDALIYVLNKTIDVLRKYKQIKLTDDSDTDWDKCIKWCEVKLDEVWKDRGAYPGLGAVLCATGVPYGYDIAEIVKANVSDFELWKKIPDILQDIEQWLDSDRQGIAKSFTKAKRKTWVKGYYKEQKEIMEMLSRINMSPDQAALLFDFDITFIKNIEYLLDMELEELAEKALDNPYILYEKTRMLPADYRFGIEMIDLAMFPHDVVREACPPQESYNIEEPDDERRLRAIATALLEKEACQGNTLALSEKLVEGANAFRSDILLDLDINVREKTLKVHEYFFADEFLPLKVQGNNTAKSHTAYQLNRLAKHDQIIRKFFEARQGKTLDLSDNWEALLEDALDGQEKSDKEHERKAREEKIDAIKKMATTRVSVLTGGAGTGKTTTLVGLCLNKTIQAEGIVVLAPTGKARVVLSQKLTEKNIAHSPYTLFQYLQKSSHCDYATMSYYLSGQCDTSKYGTVIIDECSMLTEEMLGALTEAVASAKRVIFVGDPNQLPPIGAGKPFFEMVSHFRVNHPSHLALLAVSNRQKHDGSTNRLDIELAKLYTENQQKEVDDNIFARIMNDSENIEFKRFNSNEEIGQILFSLVSEVAKMSSLDDYYGFDCSLGGVPSADGAWMNFNNISLIDNWQILSPYRNDQLTGSSAINRYIKNKYRNGENIGNEGIRRRKTSSPLGGDSIVYGDKVINLRNQGRNYKKTPWYLKGYSPITEKRDKCVQYIANGEIGMVNSLMKAVEGKNPHLHCVEFSSQQGITYRFYSGIGDDGDSDLELAYALTIHKAQGSGFKSTIFVINEPEKGVNPFLSRELIYTALTRHSNKIYILYNKAPWELKKYSESRYSDLARRLTNLFITPHFYKNKDRWYDEHLIHLTLSGDWVRSKSEVIIANELTHAGILYKYEEELTFTDGSRFLPDFTIIGKHNGNIYWEHLGMLHDEDYRKRWEVKKTIYEKHGISEENGNLIITSDNDCGGIDSSPNSRIAQVISQLRSLE